MVTIKDLTVKVTYRVGLGEVEMPEKVHQQLLEASENGDEIEIGGISKYPDAYEWLSDNIREPDCMDWSAEIEDVSENGL
jgi:hypothetical protein